MRVGARALARYPVDEYQPIARMQRCSNPPVPAFVPGPGWKAPAAVPDKFLASMLASLPGGAPADATQTRPVFTAWLNYLAMCAGIGAPGTLQEILRGYFGDKTAPERFAPNSVVKAGPVEIGPGVGPVKLGPIRYNTNSNNKTAGYQRPVELATVRLRNMVEVLSNWDDYVSNPLTVAQRGATFLFDEQARHRRKRSGGGGQRPPRPVPPLGSLGERPSLSSPDAPSLPP